MSDDQIWPYRMDDGDGDGGDGDGGDGGDDGGYDDDQDQNDDQDQDDDAQEQDADQDQDADPDGGDGNNDDDDFNDPDNLIGLDDDTALSASDFPNATEGDFQPDDGSWSADDYQQSAQNLFGDHEFFGDTMATQRTSEGFTPFTEPGILQGFEQAAPGSSETLQLFERDGQLHAFGFVTQAMLTYLMMQYTGVDFSNVDVSVPPRGEPVPPQPLPPAYDSVAVQDAVDLRKAVRRWAIRGRLLQLLGVRLDACRAELVGNMKNGDAARLVLVALRMLELQHWRGRTRKIDVRLLAAETEPSGGPDPGRVLAEEGILPAGVVA